MNKDTQSYNIAQSSEDRNICNLLSTTICSSLPNAENKIWHAHPVWFLDGNPIVGYSKLKIVFACYSGAASLLMRMDYKMRGVLKLLKYAIRQQIRSIQRI